MAPLSLSSLPEMLMPSSPGMVVMRRSSSTRRVSRAGRSDASRIVLTAQGSTVTRHAKGRR